MADVAVCGIYFATTVVIGFRAGGAQSSSTQNSSAAADTEEYFVAGRAMGRWTVGLSSMAALYSGMTMLGSPGYTYLNGPVMWPASLTVFVVVPCTVALIPVLHGAKLTSAYEYLELRFNRSLRLVGAILFLIRIIGYLGGALYIPVCDKQRLVVFPMFFEM
eukprot:SAG31_NODE_3715_length_3955_cov_10.723288_4_plen_162_part_00